MKKKRNIDRLEMLAFFNGLVFYAPVALLVHPCGRDDGTVFCDASGVVADGIFV